MGTAAGQRGTGREEDTYGTAAAQRGQGQRMTSPHAWLEGILLKWAKTSPIKGDIL